MKIPTGVRISDRRGSEAAPFSPDLAHDLATLGAVSLPQAPFAGQVNDLAGQRAMRHSATRAEEARSGGGQSWSEPVADPHDKMSARVDWHLVVQLRRTASDEITANAATWSTEAGRSMPASDREMMGRSVVRRVVRQHAERLASTGQALWPLDVERAYVTAVEDAIFGYGRLQPLFEIPDAENIEINGWDSVTIQYGDGRREPHPAVADSDEELIEAVRFLGELANPSRPFDDAHPMMTIAVGSTHRLHGVAFGIASRPSIVIRQHILTSITMKELVSKQMMPLEVGRLLHDSVLARKSMVISGDQGAGKTTLLRALIAAIPSTERFGTIETDYELLAHLQPGRTNVLAMQAKVGMGETQGGKALGEYTVADLIPEALRQNLSRLVVGEVRGSEAGAMFEAMQSGAGSLSTTHSHNAASTMDRLASRVAQGGVLSVAEAYRQIAQNLHLLVHVRLDDDTWRGGARRRYVSEVRLITGAMENDRPVTHLIYQAETPGQAPIFHPDPQLVDELREFAGVWERS